MIEGGEAEAAAREWLRCQDISWNQADKMAGNLAKLLSDWKLAGERTGMERAATLIHGTNTNHSPTYSTLRGMSRNAAYTVAHELEAYFLAEIRAEAASLGTLKEPPLPIPRVEKSVAEVRAEAEARDAAGVIYAKDSMLGAPAISLDFARGRLGELVRKHGNANDANALQTLWEVRAAEQKVLEAGKELLAKMERVESSKEYLAVWQFVALHGSTYLGESWSIERDRLRAAVDELRAVKGKR